MDKAIASYGRLLVLNPDLAAAHHNLGNALCELGRLDEAEASYRRALALQPNFASAHNNLGTVLYERDRVDEAVACYRQALSLEPDYAEALNNLGGALCRMGDLDQGEALIRRALVLKPDFAGAHDNLGAVLWDEGKLDEAEASIRRALALAPAFTRALDNLGTLLRDRGRLDEAMAVYRRLLQIVPDDIDGLNGLASLLAANGDAAAALEMVHRSLGIGQSQKARRIFVDIVKNLQWTNDNVLARAAMTRALIEPWARPSELAPSAASLIKQSARIHACVMRAVRAWPRPLSAAELFGADGLKTVGRDQLLLALLVSAQNTDVELERFLTMARRSFLDAAADEGSEGLEFRAALARQCFINEYVFFQDEEETRKSGQLRGALVAALETGGPISAWQLLAVASYFPLHAVSGAARLLDRAWAKEIAALLVQQIKEPLDEAQLRAAIPRLAPIKDKISRLVQNQYEENPYPRWVRMPRVEKVTAITGYLRRKFPLAPFQHHHSGDVAEFLSAGCGTGQLALEIADGIRSRVLAVDLSLPSLGYAGRKARELGLAGIEFAQADLLELGGIGRSFDVVECSGVLHHMADPFAGWRALLSLLRPGGFMVVGLYSDLARQGIVEARRFIAERGYGASADDIRRCRQDLLEMNGKAALATGFGDFFGVSSCRDLLFHVQEQRMRLPAIAAFLKDNGLTFLGFETDDATISTYRRRFPDDPAAIDLQHWDVFESENPDTFSRMYVFWIQKKMR